MLSQWRLYRRWKLHQRREEAEVTLRWGFCVESVKIMSLGLRIEWEHASTVEVHPGQNPRWLRDPLLPWYNGKREIPLGQVCKLCPLVSRRTLLVQKAVALVYNTTDDIKTNINPNTNCRWLNVSGTSLQVMWWMMYDHHICKDFSYT